MNIKLIEDKMKIIEELTKNLGSNITSKDYFIKDLGCPHKPESLQKGCAAIYIFVYTQGDEVLKIGKVNTKSGARFNSQHYGFNAKSTLARSLCNDKEFIKKGVNENNVKAWMLSNLQRIDICIDGKCGKAATELVEAVLHYAFKPRFEGNI